MPLLLFVILFACVIGIALALITLSLQRISGRVIDQYKDRLDDANSIVNQGRPPESWVQPFKQRLEGAAPGSQEKSPPRVQDGATRRADSVERIGEQAKRHCLKRLKTLIAFMEKGKFYDGDETREVVLNSLWSEYKRWASCHGYRTASGRWRRGGRKLTIMKRGSSLSNVLLTIYAVSSTQCLSPPTTSPLRPS